MTRRRDTGMPSDACIEAPRTVIDVYPTNGSRPGTDAVVRTAVQEEAVPRLPHETELECRVVRQLAEQRRDASIECLERWVVHRHVIAGGNFTLELHERTQRRPAREAGTDAPIESAREIEFVRASASRVSGESRQLEPASDLAAGDQIEASGKRLRARARCSATRELQHHTWREAHTVSA